jgi:hypothetical protein
MEQKKCTHWWHVTSECPKCLRAELDETKQALVAVTRERDKLSVLAELSDGYRRERDELRKRVALLEVLL